MLIGLLLLSIPELKKLIYGLKKRAMIKETCNDEVHCLTAKTADRPLTEVRIMKQKNKGSKKNKKKIQGTFETGY